VSPLWRIYFYPLLRSSAVWLALQPWLSSFAPILEGELVVLGALLAFGAQAALPRERVEYLLQLPRARAEAVRSMHIVAMIVLVTTCLFDHVAHAFRLMSLLGHWLSGHGTKDWPVDFAQGPWLNLYGLPLLAYWTTVVLLQRRRRQSQRMLPHVSWLVLVGAVAMYPLLLLTVPSAIDASTSRTDLAWRNVPGALSVVGAWWLARRALARAERLGVDAFPQEELAWES